MVVAAHVPIMVIEGIVTTLCVVFLKKVQPSMLPAYSRKDSLMKNIFLRLEHVLIASAVVCGAWLLLAATLKPIG